MRKVKIRFMRRGRYKKPFYDIIVVYKDRPATTKCIEKIGIFDPNPKTRRFWIDSFRLAYWLHRGAEMNFKIKKFVSHLWQN